MTMIVAEMAERAVRPSPSSSHPKKRAITGST
jgi:hypothetical protein